MPHYFQLFCTEVVGAGVSGVHLPAYFSLIQHVQVTISVLADST